MSSAIYLINTIIFMGTFYNYAGCLKTNCLTSQKETSKQNMNQIKRTIHDNSFVFRHPELYQSLHFRLFQCSCQSYVLQVNMADSLETIVAQKLNSSFDIFAKNAIIITSWTILNKYTSVSVLFALHCSSIILRLISIDSKQRLLFQSDNKSTIKTSYSDITRVVDQLKCNNWIWLDTILMIVKII